MNSKVFVTEKDDGNVLEILGKDGVLRIAVWLGVTYVNQGKSKKVYEIFCPLCEEDPLAKSLSFSSYKNHLKLGSLPCLCTERNKKLRKFGLDVFIGSVFNKKGKGILRVISSKPRGKNTSNTKYLVTCSICNEDVEMYGGSFETTKGHLIEGKYPCPCSGKYKLTKAQRELKILRKCKTLNYTFLGWVNIDGYSNSKFKLLCDKGHTTTSLTYKQFINKEAKCPSCSKSGFKIDKPSILYIVLWTFTNKSVIKFGITNNTTLCRVSVQSSRSKGVPEILFEFKGTGKEVLDCETKIKKLSGVGCSRDLLPEGFTETLLYTPENLEKILKIVEECGLK